MGLGLGLGLGPEYTSGSDTNTIQEMVQQKQLQSDITNITSALFS